MNLTEYWSRLAGERSATRIDLEPGEYQAEEWIGETPHLKRMILVKNEHGEFFKYPYLQLEGEQQLYSTLPGAPTEPDQPSLFWITE